MPACNRLVHRELHLTVVRGADQMGSYPGLTPCWQIHRPPDPRPWIPRQLSGPSRRHILPDDERQCWPHDDFDGSGQGGLRVLRMTCRDQWRHEKSLGCTLPGTTRKSALASAKGGDFGLRLATS